ncbi:hypothetical protein T265_07244 [Opisthorchis viverrini]|uniref:protein-serine/threonine phosphatase n=1 Tax=Opisthorchis viverrini TaxID=6198 RepID=A0A074ZDK9_OPIVI|nr:hypothetical protein T265_07244 [Opisthorchis viverrini]KER25258.1 hypothetical protein T265_07244 [Opisthorchis viverrini]
MKDLCAECGANLRREGGLSGERIEDASAKIPMVHAVPDLHVSESVAAELALQDEQSLLAARKLVLLVDLDETVLHTTNDPQAYRYKNVSRYCLPGSPLVYHTSFRPHLKTVLDRLSKYYQMHICTFGNRMYAHQLAGMIDPKRRYFAHRILSRDECFNPVTKSANLKQPNVLHQAAPCFSRYDIQDIGIHNELGSSFFQDACDTKHFAWSSPSGRQGKESSVSESLAVSSAPVTSETTDLVKTNGTEPSTQLPVEPVDEVASEPKTHLTSDSQIDGTSATSDDSSAKTETERDGCTEPSSNSVVEADPEPDSSSASEGTHVPLTPEELFEAADGNYLLRLQDILISLHRSYFREYDRWRARKASEIDRVARQRDGTGDQESSSPSLSSSPSPPLPSSDHQQTETGCVPNLAHIIAQHRANVLGPDCHITLSGLAPSHLPERCFAARIARNLGAVLHGGLRLPPSQSAPVLEESARVTQSTHKEPSTSPVEALEHENVVHPPGPRNVYTTHLIACRRGTEKHNAATEFLHTWPCDVSPPPLHIVSPHWLWACHFHWTRFPESDFPLVHDYHPSEFDPELEPAPGTFRYARRHRRHHAEHGPPPVLPRLTEQQDLFRYHVPHRSSKHHHRHSHHHHHHRKHSRHPSKQNPTESSLSQKNVVHPPGPRNVYTTHLIACRRGTEKHNAATEFLHTWPCDVSPPPLHIVSPHWLWACHFHWTRFPESDFPLVHDYHPSEFDPELEPAPGTFRYARRHRRHHAEHGPPPVLPRLTEQQDLFRYHVPHRSSKHHHRHSHHHHHHRKHSRHPSKQNPTESSLSQKSDSTLTTPRLDVSMVQSALESIRAERRLDKQRKHEQHRRRRYSGSSAHVAPPKRHRTYSSQDHTYSQSLDPADRDQITPSSEKGSMRAILLYGCETRPVRAAEPRRHQVFNNRCLKITARVGWCRRIRNEAVKKRVFGCVTGTSIEECVQHQKLRWLGHVLQVDKESESSSPSLSSSEDERKQPQARDASRPVAVDISSQNSAVAIAPSSKGHTFPVDLTEIAQTEEPPDASGTLVEIRDADEGTEDETLDYVLPGDTVEEEEGTTESETAVESHLSAFLPPPKALILADNPLLHLPPQATSQMLAEIEDAVMEEDTEKAASVPVEAELFDPAKLGVCNTDSSLSSSENEVREEGAEQVEDMMQLDEDRISTQRTRVRLSRSPIPRRVDPVELDQRALQCQVQRELLLRRRCRASPEEARKIDRKLHRLDTYLRRQDWRRRSADDLAFVTRSYRTMANHSAAQDTDSEDSDIWDADYPKASSCLQYLIGWGPETRSHSLHGFRSHTTPRCVSVSPAIHSDPEPSLDWWRSEDAQACDFREWNTCPEGYDYEDAERTRALLMRDARAGELRSYAERLHKTHRSLTRCLFGTDDEGDASNEEDDAENDEPSDSSVDESDDPEEDEDLDHERWEPLREFM